MVTVMAAPRAGGTRESTLGRGCQTHAGLAVLYSARNQLLLGFFVVSSFSSSSFTSASFSSYSLSLFLSLSSSLPIYQSLSVGHLLAPCSRAFLLLEGTTFFLVAPAMGGNQTSLCTTNEKHDYGNASAGVLRQWRPSSSTTHRSSPSFSLPLNSSLIAHSSSPFLLLRPVTCYVLLPPREPCLRFSSRAHASFLLPVS